MNDAPFPMELAGDEEALQTWVLAQIEKDPQFQTTLEASVGKWEKVLEEAMGGAETAFQDLEVAFKKHKIDVDISGLTQ